MFIRVLILSLPFIAIIVSYIILDPFRVLRHYTSFSDRMAAIPNRDYVSTQMYLNTYQQRQYNSFILGNSRTMAFRVNDWKQYIGNSSVFHYDASGESLYGVWKKLQFLEQHQSKIDNVLIICDHELLKVTKDYESHILRKDPRVTGDFPVAFQLSFFKAYLSNHFYWQYLKYLRTHEFTPEMVNMLESRNVYFDPLTNDLTLPDLDQSIAKDSLGFYTNNTQLSTRKPGVAEAVISGPQQQQLVAISNIFKRNRTKFQIVISPLYYQKQLNPADLSLLQRIFGKEHVHDFSGVNEFTVSRGNYYEDSHYRPFIGRRIMQRIYSN